MGLRSTRTAAAEGTARACAREAALMRSRGCDSILVQLRKGFLVQFPNELKDALVSSYPLLSC